MSDGDYTKAAQVALEREASDVASTAAGGRSRVLRRAAYNLGRLVGAGVLDESTVEAELVRASEVNGHIADDGQAQVVKTIRKGMTAGRQNPRNVQGNGYKCREHSGLSLPTQPINREAPDMELPNDRWLVRARTWFDGLNRLPDQERPLAERALMERGLDPRRAYTELGIKWNYQKSHWESLAIWGVEPYTNDGGQLVKDLMLAHGLVIGATWGGVLIGLEIRRDDAEVKKYGKYCQVVGSAKPMAYCVGNNGLPVIICESALDAALVYQETGGAYQCIASMGNAKTLPKPYVALVQQAPAVYYIPDNDAGGDDGAAKILADFPNAQIKTLPPKVKDPSALAKLHYQGQAQFLPTVREWLASVGLIQGQVVNFEQPTMPTETPAQARALPSYKADSTLPAWGGDYVDGNPVCNLPAYIRQIMHERGLDAYAVDLKGYGIPYQGLPKWLQGFSKTGWRVVDAQGGNGPLELVAVASEPRNEYGNLAYLKAHEQQIRKAMSDYERYMQFYSDKG